MELKDNEIKYTSKFLIEEVPRSMGMLYIPEKIRSCFNINQKDDIWRVRKKKQEEE